MNQKEICRIIGMARAPRHDRWRKVLTYINRKRGLKYETFTATDGRALARFFRSIPEKEKSDCLVYESALLDARGKLAKDQEQRFPNTDDVFPREEGDAVFTVSISWILERLKNAVCKNDFLHLETGGLFYVDAHNDATLLNPRYVRTMAQQVRALQGYGFGDNVCVSVWPKTKGNNPPVLFTASNDEQEMTFDFLMMPAVQPREAGYLGANVKIN